jgi:hypothetical protein
MFALYDYSEKRKETLAQYYLRTYKHLVPKDVEFWEYKEGVGAKILHSNKSFQPTANASAEFKRYVVKISTITEKTK